MCRSRVCFKFALEQGICGAPPSFLRAVVTQVKLGLQGLRSTGPRQPLKLSVQQPRSLLMAVGPPGIAKHRVMIGAEAVASTVVECGDGCEARPQGRGITGNRLFRDRIPTAGSRKLAGFTER